MKPKKPGKYTLYFNHLKATRKKPQMVYFRQNEGVTHSEPRCLKNWCFSRKNGGSSTRKLWYDWCYFTIFFWHLSSFSSCKIAFSLIPIFIWVYNWRLELLFLFVKFVALNRGMFHTLWIFRVSDGAFPAEHGPLGWESWNPDESMHRRLWMAKKTSQKTTSRTSSIEIIEKPMFAIEKPMIAIEKPMIAIEKTHVLIATIDRFPVKKPPWKT